MVTKNGPKVIEYNCRFGDPEAQVVLPLLESDLLTVMQACRNGTLAETEVSFSSDSACCVIMASDGYPSSYQKGFEITFDPDLSADVYIAGAKLEEDKLLTNGGRVLMCIAHGEDVKHAQQKVYQEIQKIHCTNLFYRKDIAHWAL
jgi:phosphoribosylamine--glycine ligase